MHDMMMGEYGDKPSFKLYGVKVPDAPDDEFEATVKLRITRQDTPLHGPPCVEFTVMDLQSDAIEMEEAEESRDSGDSLAADLEKAVMKKSEVYPEGDED